MYKYDCETTSYVGYDNTRVPPVIVITLAMNMIPHFELLPAITFHLLLNFSFPSKFRAVRRERETKVVSSLKPMSAKSFPPTLF